MRVYKHKLCPFSICEIDNGKYELRIDDSVLQTFDTLRQAKTAVYDRQTGYKPWDSVIAGLKPPIFDKWMCVDET